MMQHPLALAVEASQNRKTGLVHATYAAQASCPPSCPFQGNGCYAENGPIGIHTRRLNRAADVVQADPLEVARAEANAIEEQLSGKHDLRVHVVGDCSTTECAAIVAEAAARKVQDGRVAFSYTHAWKNVDQKAWDGVSILASCETPEQVEAAYDQGWNSAVVVDRFPHSGVFELPNGRKAFACPAQTHGMQCVDCRLCLRQKDGYLSRRGISIAFEVHGTGARRIREAGQLVQLTR